MAKITAQHIVNARGRRIGIILPLRQYEMLVEDLHDLATVTERRSESPMPIEEMCQRLERD